MAKEQHDTKKYQASDFERYYNGRMTPEEMHALEKAALDDPFLSDALEGYAHSKEPVDDITELNNRFNNRKNRKKILQPEKKSIPLILKIAAIFLFVAGISWLLYEQKKSPTSDLASNDHSVTTAKVPLAANAEKTDTMKQAEALTLLDKRKENIPSASANTPLTKQFTDSLQKNNFTTDVDEKAIAVSGTFDNKALDTPATVNLNYTDNDLAGRKDDEALAWKTAGKETLQAYRPVKGKITDNLGNGISYANVLEKRTRKGATADRNGAFILNTPDTAPSVEISAPGYETSTKKLITDSSLTNYVVLNTTTVSPHNEVVVAPVFSSTGSKKAEKLSPKSKKAIAGKDTKRITVTNVIPLNGWNNFNQYVGDSLQTLEQLGPGAVSAEIQVSFNVNENGNPTDIEVSKSICHLCEKEAYRIIQNSPPWKLNLIGKKGQAIIRFY